MQNHRFLVLIAFTVLSLAPHGSSAANLSGDKSPKLRVDCRFYDTTPRFCYASAIYNLRGSAIVDIRYGVGCDHETLYDDGGTYAAQERVSDGLRPRTAATPKIELFPENSLRHPGTYSAKLEIERGKLTDGTCYVSEVYGHDDQYFPEW